MEIKNYYRKNKNYRRRKQIQRKPIIKGMQNGEKNKETRRTKRERYRGKERKINGETERAKKGDKQRTKITIEKKKNHRTRNHKDAKKKPSE